MSWIHSARLCELLWSTVSREVSENSEPEENIEPSEPVKTSKTSKLVDLQGHMVMLRGAVGANTNSSDGGKELIGCVEMSK